MTKVITGFIAALSSLIVIGSVFVSSLIYKVELSDLAIRAYDTIHRLESLLSHLSDAESAALEYSLAGERRYLDRYELNRSAIQDDLNTLRTNVMGDADQASSLKSVESLMHDKMHLLEKLVRLNHNHPEFPDHLAQEERLVHLGEITMGHARTAIESMQNSVDAVLTVRLKEMERARTKTSSYLLAGTLLTIGIVTWLLYIVQRETVQRIRAQEALRKSNAELEGRVQDRTLQLRLSNDRLRTLSRQVIQVQEQERRRIARDMHDEIGHSLIALKLELQEIKDQVEGSAAEPLVRGCIEFVGPLLQQVRRLALELRPSLLDELGLHEASKWYVMQFAKRTGLTVAFNSESQSSRFSEEIEITAFRVLQESLNNVVKHAHATSVTIVLRQIADCFQIKICDNGAGFVPAEARAGTLKGESFGLSSMEERVRLVGGTLRVVSAPKIGTEISATFPIERINQVPHMLEGVGHETDPRRAGG